MTSQLQPLIDVLSGSLKMQLHNAPASVSSV